MSLPCPNCGSVLDLIGTAPDGSFLLRCLDHTSVPAPGHVDRYSGNANAPPHHFDYYVLPLAGGPPLPYRANLVPGDPMHPEQRLWMLEVASIEFLRKPEETDYLVIGPHGPASNSIARP